jgi:hypothetical protein
MRPRGVIDSVDDLVGHSNLAYLPNFSTAALQ